MLNAKQNQLDHMIYYKDQGKHMFTITLVDRDKVSNLTNQWVYFWFIDHVKVGLRGIYNKSFILSFLTNNIKKI